MSDTIYAVRRECAEELGLAPNKSDIVVLRLISLVHYRGRAEVIHGLERCQPRTIGEVDATWSVTLADMLGCLPQSLRGRSS